MPVAVSCSYAFMLPASNPVGSIIQEAGGLSVIEMVKTGAAVKFLCILFHLPLHLVYGDLLFDFGNYEYQAVNLTTPQPMENWTEQ